MKYQGQKIVVVGLGASGLSAVRFLLCQGAEVWAIDSSENEQVEHRADALRKEGAQVVLGSHPKELLLSANTIVLSPGVPFHSEFSAAKKQGALITNDVEIAFQELEVPVIAITGTNGKSTVTTWVGEILESAHKLAFVGGNLGRPVLESLEVPSKKDAMMVFELSSFQLEQTQTFAPKISAILNVAEDHLDRYPSFETYAETKARIFKSQTNSDYLVVPQGDPIIHKLTSQCKAQIHYFGGKEGEVRLEEGFIFDEVSGLKLSVKDLQVIGEHNFQNACATALICRLAGLKAEQIKQGLIQFKGLPHRMYSVATIDGVTYYNDSKATNVHAAVTALQGLSTRHKKVVLIAGGKDKGGSYLPLKESLESVGRAAVLIGESRHKIQRALEGTAIHLAFEDSLEDAVKRAKQLALPGDAILLAPACSSFDMFGSYEHRGEVFQAAVQSLIKKDLSNVISKK